MIQRPGIIYDGQNEWSNGQRFNEIKSWNWVQRKLSM